MKLIRFILLITTTISRTSANGDSESPRVPQQACPDLLAVKILQPPPGVTKSPTSWIIAKVTRMTESYPNDFVNKDQNTCSPTTYGPHCAGIHLYRIPNLNDHGYTTHKYADHKIVKNIVHFVEEFKSKDPIYQIYEGEIQKMEYIFEDKQSTIPEERMDLSAEKAPMKHVKEKQLVTRIEEIPDFVKEARGKMFAVIYMSDDGRWLVMRTCDKKDTWVALSWQYPVTDPPQTIFNRSKAKIDEKLHSFGIDLTTMLDVPLDSFKFDMYNDIFGKGTSSGEAGTSGAPTDSNVILKMERVSIGEGTSSMKEYAPTDGEGTSEIVEHASSGEVRMKEIEEE